MGQFRIFDVREKEKSACDIAVGTRQKTYMNSLNMGINEKKEKENRKWNFGGVSNKEFYKFHWKRHQSVQCTEFYSRDMFYGMECARKYTF